MQTCPTQDQLMRFLGDLLERPEREALAEHIQTCVRCQQLLVQITTGPETACCSSSCRVGDDLVARVLAQVRVNGPGPVLTGAEGERPVDDEAAPAQVEESAGETGERAAAAAAPSRRHPAIDGYTIIREIGRGGMGVVYEAEDEKLSRRVALKILPGASPHDENQIKRFDREARAAARLHHTNIVPVFGVGHQDGRPYYVMQYIAGWGLDIVLGELRRLVQPGASPRPVQGVQPHGEPRPADPGLQANGQEPRRIDAAHVARSLATGMFAADNPLSSELSATDSHAGQTTVLPQQAGSRPPPVRDSSLPGSPGSSVLAVHGDFRPSYFKALGRIGLQVADAMEYANRQGVLHRDIKPSNLLLDASGNVWVADFGLAKTTEAGDLTQTGQFVGTIRYMAPERFGGRCDARSDVYSLGLTMYELAALRPAFEESDRYKLIDQIRRKGPRQLKALAPKVPRDLETIIQKSIAPDPAHRYGTAATLADDLRRYLEDRPIRARRASRPERVLRWCRRNPWAAFSIAVLCLGTAVSTWQALRATAASRAASLAEAATRKERDRAERSRDLAFEAANTIISTDQDQMSIEEAIPFRAMLLDEGLRLSQEMTKGAEGDARAEKLSAKAQMMEAKIVLAKGDRRRAYEIGKRAVDVFEGLVARDPDEIDNRDGLALFLYQLAPLAIDREAARSAATRSSEIYQALLRENPDAKQASSWIGQLALDLHNIGHAYFDESASTNGQTRLDLLHKAIEAFRRATIYCQQQVERGDRGESVLLCLALNERYLCRAYRDEARQLHDPHQSSQAVQAAIAWGRKAVSHFRIPAENEPTHFEKRWALHEAQRELGILFLDMDKLHDATEFFKQARDTLRVLGERHGKFVSRTVRIQESLAIDDFNLINALSADSAANDELIRQLVDEAYPICDKLDLVRPLSRDLRKTYGYLAFAKADAVGGPSGFLDVDLNRKAERLYTGVLEEDPNDFFSRCYLVLMRFFLADALAARGESEEAMRFERGAMAVTRGRPDACFQTAVTYAWSAKAAVEGPSKLDAQQKAMHQHRCARRVVPMLREAFAAGFKDYKRLRNEPAFAAFRSDPEFQAVVRDMEFPTDAFAR
ncbi:MAG: serine/threonine-protein kinase [Isosphaeraceae bacterium]